MKKISLGIHIGHDRGASLVIDGELVGSIAQERLDRIKHSRSIEIPYDSIDQLLNYNNISIEDINCIGFSGDAMEAEWVLLKIKDDFINHYDIKEIPFYAVSHHDSHAFATYCMSGYNEALVLIADGGGDYIDDMAESESLYVANKKDIIPIDKRLQNATIKRMSNESNYLFEYMPNTVRKQQISVARKYEQITYMLGFGWGQAGKTMGLASYGKSLIDYPKADVSGLDVDLKYEDILKNIFVLQQLSGKSYTEYISENAANIAQTVQDYTEHIIIEIVDSLVKDYKINYLCLGGGLFLNCMLNHKILEKCNINSIFILPSTGDDGQSIGNAFYAYKMHFAQIQSKKLINPYLGLDYTNELIESELCAFNLEYQIFPDSILAKKIAEAISNDKIVALHRGKTEIGPRALCHRSILANATNPDMKDIINNRIKHREPFRPFAPVVTIEKAFDIFNLKQESPFMLLAPTVKEDYKPLLPSITHVDGSARVQTVDKAVEPFIHSVLTEFEVIKGVPVIINTSFNIAGQPIVETPSDAIQTFINNDMDILVIGNCWIEKNTNLQ